MSDVVVKVQLDLVAPDEVDLALLRHDSMAAESLRSREVELGEFVIFPYDCEFFLDYCLNLLTYG